MPEPLVVHLNREELYDVEPAVEAYEATGPFAVQLHNHGRAVHVHLRFDGPVSQVAHVDAPNHFVDTESATAVRVEVPDDAPPAEGRLTVVTGYGSGEASVPVAVAEPEQPVAVDEPRPDPDEEPDDAPGGLAERLGDVDAGGTPAVGAFAVLALLLGGGAVAATGSPIVAAGVGAVLVGVAIAAYLLVR